MVSLLMNFLNVIYFPKILKGNISIAPMNLKISSRVNPTILNGNNISHRIGNIKTSAKAMGQHITKRIHQRRIAMIDLIDFTNGKFSN